MRLPEQLDVVEKIEEGLGGIGRLRMLRTMLEQSSEIFTKYRLTKATRLKHVDVSNNLNTLINLGWVKELHHEPPKYQINLENEIVKNLARFFQKIKYL